MIHGNPTWSFYYRELVKALSPQFRTIVPDHLGCGFSDKPDSSLYGYSLVDRVNDIEFLIDKLKLKGKINLIAHDWGGMIGMAYALKYRKKIGRIIILNTAAFLPPEGKRLPFRLWIIRKMKSLAPFFVQRLNLFAISALYMATAKGLNKNVKAGLIAPYNSPGNRTAILKFVEDIPLCGSHKSYGLIKEVDNNLYKLKDIPMMICWGKKDFVFDDDYLSQWRYRFPKAKVREFPQAGHYILEDVPELIIPLIKKFLEK